MKLLIVFGRTKGERKQVQGRLAGPRPVQPKPVQPVMRRVVRGGRRS